MTLRSALLALAILFCAPSAQGLGAEAQASRTLSGHVPTGVARLAPLSRLPADTNLYLVLGLPLRNQDGLTNLMRQLSDPADPKFRQWLTADQFTAQFGPTEEDYQKVIRFAEAHGLKVSGTHPNRTIVDVTAPASAVEQTFGIHLQQFRHPTEGRTFYAPDSEPVVPADLPLLHVAGLDNYSVPRSLLKRAEIDPTSTTPANAFATGSGPGGDFTGKDFRAAYAPGVTNTGHGQYIAIVDVGGPYYRKDVTLYETNAGFSTNIVITNILLSGWTGIPVGSNQDDGEETLDIDMALSMAPGATILNYEGEAHDVFNRIATDNLAKQITMSYGFGIDASINQMFMQFVLQGQAFFQASGDGGADLPGGTGLTGELYATIVGGTSLTTSGPKGSWISESTWIGSGGGTSGYGIPSWQEGVSMAANHGSTVNRNYPDVAMLADTVIWWYLKNGQGGAVGGTSASSPQWAGFMALANETAAAQGLAPIGFLNPVVYTIGKGPTSGYVRAFHDITVGNNFNSKNPARYAATSGYDLCTGWGSPRGSNTIAALVGFGTNDFILSASQVGVTAVQGSTATSLIQVTPMNRFSGDVSLAITNLPDGVAATLNPTTVGAGASQSLLTIAIDASVAPGSYPMTLTAAGGGLAHTLTFNLTVTAATLGQTPVALRSYFNRNGIWTDGSRLNGGIDGDGYAYSANLLGPMLGVDNLLFTLGAANVNNVIACSGQTVPLPSGQYTTLQLLVTAVNGGQARQNFTITYTDNSTSVITQDFSDWAGSAQYGSESVAAALPYRNGPNGTKDFATYNLFVHALTLDQTKSVRSVTLPNNRNVDVLAMDLVDAPARVLLASLYNRAGMYADGATFTNPPTGGLDGGGHAYSASLLGGSQFWEGVQFNFGPPNVKNVISCAGQIAPLPPGNYLTLKFLAASVGGSRAAQSFEVTYTDGSTASFTQGVSDWFTPQNFAGESKAILMGHRNVADGSKDNRTFYLYGYSLNLDSSKIAQSLRLPSNTNVIVASVSLTPNPPPIFTLNSINLSPATAGQAYIGSIAGDATDPSGDPLTFAKVSGPAWLSVTAGGGLSGTPASGDAGLNTFVVSAANPAGIAATATLALTVTAPVPVVLFITPQSTNLMLTWNGGSPPYQVLSSTNLAPLSWFGVGGPFNATNLLIIPTNAAAYYQVVGQ